MDDQPITLANPAADSARFYRGMTIVFAAPWWVRLWRWFKFRVLRRPRPVWTVTAVDYGDGAVTIEGGTQRP